MENKICIYLAEGECEEKLLKALKLKPELIVPGRVKKFNVIRHMTREKLDSYSPALRAFFGFLVYENKAELNEFVRENDESFNNLPEQTIDALIEITHSEELERFKKEYRTPEGGVNVCYGIQVYGNQREMAGIVRHAQKHGFSIAETVKDIMSDYMLKEKDAKEVVEKYWKKDVGTSETK